jgi:Fe-S-cluster containining protein
MNSDYKKHINLAAQESKVIRKTFQHWKRKAPNKLDEHFHKAHDEAFENIDCLECANCCKTTSPIFIDRDIDRIASHLRMKPSAFVTQYLRLDEDGDYVLQKSPCTFLGEDNYCSIYDVRPRACREYPHTNRKNMQQILDLTQKNTEICPAVAKIVLQLKSYL